MAQSRTSSARSLRVVEVHDDPVEEPTALRHPAADSVATLEQADLRDRLERIESLLRTLVDRQQTRDWYTTDQIAEILGKSAFTVREWARLGRIHAEKRMSGRGAHPQWVVSHTELLRFQREGLIPRD